MTRIATSRSAALQGYVSGRLFGAQARPADDGQRGGVRNPLATSGSDDFDAPLRRMGRGPLVGELSGHGVNNVTGDYPRAAGFWVEDGEIQHPVNEITIAGNLKDLVPQIVAIGTDIDVRGAMRTGSRSRRREMTIAGASAPATVVTRSLSVRS